MLFERFNKYPDIIPPIDKKKLIALSKKLLPDTIFIEMCKENRNWKNTF